MSDIKIFVSHRIDQQSETIDNPLYVNVRCGAVYDKRTPEEIGGMLGDNTGDNISEKRMTYNELTIQYWAWKNVQADYYGICHYRRYLSFSDTEYPVGIGGTYSGCIVESDLDDKSIKKYQLDNQKLMQEQIEDNDILVFQHFDVKKAKYRSIKHSMSIDSRFFDINDMETCLSIIKENFPEIYDDAVEYLNQNNVYFYNCFIMKKELFNTLCDFEFKVLFELEQRIDISTYSIHKQRVFGLIGEHLVGMFIYHMQKQEKYKISEKQLIYFENANKSGRDLYPAFPQNNVTVVMSSSDFFAPYLAVCIKSIILTSSNQNNYDIIIIEREISELNKARILSMTEKHENISIRFCNVSHKVKDIKFYINGQRLSQETYYGLLMPWLLPNHSKAIIMDCDMIIKRDIADLYHEDISGKLAGAVNDAVLQGLLNDTATDAYDYYVKKLKIRNPYKCFNGGLLLLDLQQFKEAYSWAQVCDIITHYKLRIVDQDIFNILLQNKVKLLDVRWNHMICIKGWVADNLSYAPAAAQNCYFEARKNPYIIHYANVVKPWDDPNVEFGDDFWQVARQTPFYEGMLARRMDSMIGGLCPAIQDLQIRMGVFDNRTGVRKLADKILPKGSRRRFFAKKLLPKGSHRWNFLKQIYFIFRPKYRPKKKQDDNMEDVIIEDELRNE